jgi:hypothetical protein
MRSCLDDAAAAIARHAPGNAARALARGLSRLPGWAIDPARIIANRASMAA